MGDKEVISEVGQGKEFSLSSTNTAFTERSKDVFQSLQVLEEKHKEHEKTREDISYTENDLLKNDPTDEDTEVLSKATFKKPDALHSSKLSKASSVTDHDKQLQFSRNSKKRSHDDMQCSDRNQHYNNSQSQGRRNLSPMWQRGRKMNRNQVPDHKTNPQKWTKYSLADVSEDDLSESANTWAAFSFLEDLKKQRAAREGKPEEVEPADVEGGACSKGHIAFKCPNKLSKNKIETGKNSDTSNKNEAYNKIGHDILADSDMIENVNSVEVSDNRTNVEQTKFRVTRVKSKRNIRSRECDSDED